MMNLYLCWEMTHPLNKIILTQTSTVFFNNMCRLSNKSTEMQANHTNQAKAGHNRNQCKRNCHNRPIWRAHPGSETVNAACLLQHSLHLHSTPACGQLMHHHLNNGATFSTACHTRQVIGSAALSAASL